MRRILVPPAAGVLSALGLALAAERREALASVMLPAIELTRERIGELVGRLRARAGPAVTEESWLRARYSGQGHELEVPVTTEMNGDIVAERFVEVHARRFGFTLELPVEIISARHAASGEAREARLARRDASVWRMSAGMRDDGGSFDATVDGRATIALPDATLLVERGWVARPLAMGGWEMVRE
jgi:N-methylhydantoinase A